MSEGRGRKAAIEGQSDALAPGLRSRDLSGDRSSENIRPTDIRASNTRASNTRASNTRATSAASGARQADAAPPGRARPRRSRQWFEAVDALRDLLDDIGGDCWAAGATAAALHPFDGFELVVPFHVLVQRDRRITRVHHVVHSTIELPLIDRATVDGLAVTSATRTLIDLAPTVDARRLTVAVDSALRDGLTSDDFLHRRVNALRNRGRKGTTRLLTALVGGEPARGGHSFLERAFLDLLAASGHALPETQVVVGTRSGKLIRVDCRFAGTPLVVELLGYEHHRTRMQMFDDADRMNRMLLDGLVPLQFTYPHVINAPDHVLAQVTEALARLSTS